MALSDQLKYCYLCHPVSICKHLLNTAREKTEQMTPCWRVETRAPYWIFLTQSDVHSAAVSEYTLRVCVTSAHSQGVRINAIAFGAFVSAFPVYLTKTIFCFLGYMFFQRPFCTCKPLIDPAWMLAYESPVMHFRFSCSEEDQWYKLPIACLVF